MNSIWGQALPILSLATNIVARIYTVLMTILVIVPFYPNFPKPELDPSWSLGLNEAVSKSLQFGSDIIFTYGPYSSVATKYYHPDTYPLIFFTSVLLAAIYSYFAYHSLKESTVALVLYAILVPTISTDALFLCFPLLYIKHIVNGNEDALKKYIFCIFSGVIILVKGSYFIIILIVYLFIILFFTYNKKLRFIFDYVIITITVSLFFWVFSGQNLYHIIYYIYGIYIITDGYSDAMSYQGSRYYLLLYLTSTAFILYITNSFFRYKSNKIIFLAICVSILFLLFKAGFVRQDDHVTIAFGGLIILSIFSVSYIKKYFYIQVFFILILSHTMLGNLFILSHNEYYKNINTVLTSIQLAYSNYLSGNKEYESINLHNLEIVRTSTRLPKVYGSSDLYNHDLALLIASENDWHPRPVFQSYSAYTKRLSQLNLNHLITRPPDNIFIRVETIDNRFPTLDDGASWPVLLSSYKPDSTYGSYLHLVKRDSVYLPLYNIFYDGQHKLNEFIRLPDKEIPVFATIQIQKTLIGLLKNIAYKPEPLYITLYFDDGTKETFRFIASMGESPFLITPFVSNTTEFLQLFDSTITNKRVTFISLFNNGIGTDWDHSFRLKLQYYEKQ